ncbi:glutamate-1-semialdehyde 2,1-aminomutase [Prosthecochloris sp. HL-130-GSB]|jgi:glutamate-1-semialdehyde 2,1-aminomutase|uniref:Glutamate-1-semialdehyde 2,1-aminomutase n=1 Tax=Prosthecochloris aestuarii TaxID=1102 RepID=A0A831SR16_PROAE|nr:glutamate-1-semialdehyde 2,1-aminomutase [Prosthecochloris sp. HL-130-GSB]ARM30145.1 glutamate-1-semialdehyde-2,1-aminomutase [Prosthecochloris sp. HL-130-GSB]MBO8091729.1 glutamate-1-semialdehyde 2,1-aminomutase [Prosthecochloris sp.]HED31199.1 glutamate-1-semialdehyde-2,1-aminomutase [Prosthecochloris aestuarii]
MPQLTRSAELFEKAKQFIPGGVNSPVRAFKSVGGTPVFMAKGKGAYMTDVDGNTYLDYVGSWGPFILGSMHPKVTAALEHTLTKIGTSFGTPIEMEIEIAQLLTQIVPSLEMVRMVNSGTEATMSAVRLARGYTGRDKIIKFEGCYHGHGDSFLIKAGSGALTLGTPDSPGVTKGTANDTLNAKYNDIESVRTLVSENKDNIAAIIIEPVAGNTGVIPAKKEFLQALRDLCTQEGIVLIFDEVMCGFRVALGGAQELYGITPDLTTMGKIIGGGLPVGAFGGKREIMEHVAPLGDIYQAGTLSGNPLALTAGLATLQILRDENPYPELERKASIIEEGFSDNLRKLGLNYTQNRVGSMACLFFTDKPVENHDDAVSSDVTKYSRYFQSMLDQGIYLAPSQFEAMFTSTAHSDEDIEKTIKANYAALQAAAK